MTGRWEYVLRDHQGNARIHFSDINNDGTITVNESVQESYQKFGYYPFGMQYDKDVHPFPNTLDNVVPKMRYRYTGYEDLKELDFEVYDGKARLYNPYIGRFFGADPLSVDYSQWNAYAYCLNNPIIYNDPDGKNPILGAIIGAFTEYAGIVGSQMIFEGKTFKEANSSLGWRESLDIAIAAGFGAGSGAIDGGITKFASWISNPRNQKILVKLLEVGVSALENSLKEIYKEGDFDLKSVLASTLAEVGMGDLLKTNVYKEASEQASKNSDLLTQRAGDLAKRKNVNERLVKKAKDDAAKETRTANALNYLNAAGNALKGTAAKTTSNEVQNIVKVNH